MRGGRRRPGQPIAKHEQRASRGCRVEVANWGFWERGARGVAAALEPNGLEEHVQRVSCLGVGANVVNGRRGPTEPGRHGDPMAQTPGARNEPNIGGALERQGGADAVLGSKLAFSLLSYLICYHFTPVRYFLTQKCRGVEEAPTRALVGVIMVVAAACRRRGPSESRGCAAPGPGVVVRIFTDGSWSVLCTG